VSQEELFSKVFTCLYIIEERLTGETGSELISSPDWKHYHSTSTPTLIKEVRKLLGKALSDDVTCKSLE
jgi:hypothetical protein